MNWDRKFKAYLLEHSTLSDATIDQNLSRVRGFDRWLSGNIAAPPGNVARIKSYGRPAAAVNEQIRDYFKYLQASHHPAGYRQHIKTALRYYYGFLLVCGTIKQLPDLAIPIRKNGGDHGREKRLLTDQQIELLREHFKNNLRNATMFLCLVDLGVRVHELIKLKSDDFAHALNQVTIHSTKTEGKSKYGGQRIMPLSPRLAKIVAHHISFNLKLAGTSTTECTYLFPITESQVWRIIKKAGEDNGMPWLHPHLFRHYCITKFCQTTGEDNISPVFRPKEGSMMFGVSPEVISERYDHPIIENIVSKALKAVYSGGNE